MYTTKSTNRKTTKGPVLNSGPAPAVHPHRTRRKTAQSGRWKVVCSQDGTLGRYDSYEAAQTARANHLQAYPDHDTRILGSQ